MEAQRSPNVSEQPSHDATPQPKKLTRRELLVVAACGAALALAANRWLKGQDYRRGEMIRMFCLRAAPSPFDRPDQRPNMCVVDARDVVTGEDIQIQLPVARGKYETERQERIMSADMRDDLLVLCNVGALDAARWGQVKEGNKTIIHARYDQVELRRGLLKKLRESAPERRDF